MTKNLKQSLNQVVQSIGTDVKNILSRLDRIDDKLNRKSQVFNPKFWRKAQSNRMLEIADGMFIDVHEMQRVKHTVRQSDVVYYQDSWNMIVNQDLTAYLYIQKGFELDSSLWEIQNGSGFSIQSNRLNGYETRNMTLTHPDLNEPIQFTMKSVNRTGEGVQEYLDSFDLDTMKGDFSVLKGDNVFLDSVEITFKDKTYADFALTQVLWGSGYSSVVHRQDSNKVIFTHNTQIRDKELLNYLGIGFYIAQIAFKQGGRIYGRTF